MFGEIVVNPSLVADSQIAQCLDFLKAVQPALIDVVSASVRHILCLQHCGTVECNNNNINNIYYLQLGFHPVAVNN
jgi:hypothetical protein